MDHLHKTAVYPAYGGVGAKIVNFEGWALPLQFEGILAEHQAVRKAAGVFDVSHMGEVEVTGKDASVYLNELLSNDISRIRDGQAQYSILLNENGGAVDDVMTYRFSGQHYMIVVNAANRFKDVKWMMDHTEGYQVTVIDRSDEVAQLAIQGPKAEDLMRAFAGEEAAKIRFFRFSDSIRIQGVSCLISRTGYTGEDGFEVYLSPDHAMKLWEDLLEAGKEFGLKPAGLGCRDTLRFEACLPLYGRELTEDITPLEADLEHFVKMEKTDFIGKKALAAQKERGLERKIAGFEIKGRGIPRSGYEIRKNGKKAGRVTTGYYSPTLEKNLGLALVDAGIAAPGNTIEVAIRGKSVPGITVETPFYKKKYQKYLPEPYFS